MFAKPRKPPEFVPTPETKRPTLARPGVLAFGVAALLAGGSAGAIAIAGDPSDGAPKVRIALGGPHAAKVPAGWRAALSPEGPEAADVTIDTLRLHEDVKLARIEPLLEPGAEAVITLPNGGQIGGPEPEDVVEPRDASALAAAPLPGLTAAGPNGPLPAIGPGGRTPAEAYARPFKASGKPKIALVIGGLGLNPATTRAAIETLPADVTLSFVPYAEGLQGWIDLARANGHEVLLELPMEPMDYPDNDPGPYTLLAQAQPEELNKRLDWLMSRAQGYFGVTNYLGGRFLASDTGVNTLTGALRKRGLAFLDDGQASRVQAARLPRASADRIIDDQLSDAAIDRQLLALEAAALDRGKAMGSGFAYPVTVKAVARWAQGLERRGYQLAPASAMTQG